MIYRVYVTDTYINFYKVTSTESRMLFSGFKKIKKSTYDFFLNSSFELDRGEIDRIGYTMFTLYL